MVAACLCGLHLYIKEDLWFSLSQGHVSRPFSLPAIAGVYIKSPIIFIFPCKEIILQFRDVQAKPCVFTLQSVKTMVLKKGALCSVCRVLIWSDGRERQLEN